MFSSSGVKSKIIPNQELAEELNKPIIRKFKKWNVYSSFKENICGYLSSWHPITN